MFSLLLSRVGFVELAAVSSLAGGGDGPVGVRPCRELERLKLAIDRGMCESPVRLEAKDG